MVDGTPRVLPHRINKPKMTPTLCIDSCSAQGYILAGVQNGGECHCGNTDPQISKFAPEKECNKACAGDGNLICGGSWRLSVFSTGAGCFLHFNSFGGLNSPYWLICQNRVNELGIQTKVIQCIHLGSKLIVIMSLVTSQS